MDGDEPDGLLDRHPGYPKYTDSGAWLTNHMSGTYAEGKGKKYRWTYFTKIVTPSSSATKTDGVWYNEDGIEIGPAIWGAFATVLTVDNDPVLGTHGKFYGSPASPDVSTFSTFSNFCQQSYNLTSQHVQHFEPDP